MTEKVRVKHFMEGTDRGEGATEDFMVCSY